MKTTIAKQVKAAMLVLVMGAGVIGGFAKMAEALTITSVDPEKGPVAGGQEVTITGDFSQDMKWKQISTGLDHTCAIASNDQVYCWGWNVYGQLGDSTTTDRHTPVAVQLGERPDLTVKQITAGSAHTCAIASNDQVYCWGWNIYGQLGDGTSGSGTNKSTPVAVLLGDRPDLIVKQISAGTQRTCAIASNDQAFCWGVGYLGDGTNTNSSTPVAVLLGDRPNLTVKQISAGTIQACVIASNDQAYCWGTNSNGLLGDGTTTNRYTPVAILLGDRPNLTVKQISTAGDLPQYTCAIASNNQAYCWGANDKDQIGDGTTMFRYTPVAVELGDRPNLTVKQIITADDSACAIASNDQAYCWGRNDFGQLGNGSSTGPEICPSYLWACSTLPIAVQLGDRPNLIVKQISAGGGHTCAIASDDQIYCWGYNGDGQLGNGTNTGPETTCSLLLLACSTVPIAVDTSGLMVYTVVMDPGGTPAPCTDVTIAPNGKSLTCTTSAHIAGLVDVTVDDGVSAKTLENGYEYVKDDGGGSLIKDLLSPDTGIGKVVGLVVLGEVVFAVAGMAVFFKIRKE